MVRTLLKPPPTTLTLQSVMASESQTVENKKSVSTNSTQSRPSKNDSQAPSELRQGNYLNGFGKTVTVIKPTVEHGYLFATNGYWYESSGKKALPKPLKKKRPRRSPDSIMQQDLDLSSYRPLTPRQRSDFFPDSKK